jgi:hypothetical protein
VTPDEVDQWTCLIQTQSCDVELTITYAWRFILRGERVRLIIFFHFGQSIFRAVQDRSLQTDYIRVSPASGELKTEVYQLIRLAFVPSYQVPACFDFFLEVTRRCAWLDRLHSGKMHMRKNRKSQKPCGTVQVKR